MLSIGIINTILLKITTLLDFMKSILESLLQVGKGKVKTFRVRRPISKFTFLYKFTENPLQRQRVSEKERKSFDILPI